MKVATVNTVIDEFNSLLLEEKEFAIDIIKKTFAEAKRESLLKRAKKAMGNYRRGKVKRGGLEELFMDLENDCRIIFRFIDRKRVLLIDVGSHEEVY